MPTDMELIKQLEKETGIELKKVEELNIKHTRSAYQADSNGCVVRLTLVNIKLEALSSAVSKFQKLEQLSLGSNQLRVLPPEISQLTNLKSLDLTGNQLDTLPPEIGQLTNLKSLYLGSNQLSTLPPEIRQLKNLMSLILYNNQFNTLPPEIRQLKNLTSLDLSGNQLSVLPPEIKQSTNLTSLNLTGNQLNTLTPEVEQLTNLTSLYLGFNNLSTLPPEMRQLTNLKNLYLGYNQLSKLPSEIFQLKNLTILDLSENQLSVLPPEITQLTNLTSLDLGSNQLRVLPPEIKQLKELRILYLDENQLITLPPEIGSLSNLTRMFLRRNQLRSLPPEIGQLTNLTHLDIEYNHISTLPPEITQLIKLEHLELIDNPLKQPPPEIGNAIDNIKRIRDYFEQLEAQGEDYVYEAKLILVGEPGAGKTSLAKKMMNPKYKLSPNEEMTKGIDVERWTFPYNKEIPFQCNIWDFGGQDIMHATHRYFLTKRSLYVLVADNRKEDTDFYYWLNMLELLSGKSPVLIVLNEKFKYRKYVPENIKNSFESIQDIYNVNLANNKGLADLSKAIQQYMRDLPHVGNDPIPTKWIKIRKDLEAEKEKNNYINHDDYLKICRENGIDDEERAGYISEFLHDLGVILHFQKDRILQNILILNARWATEAVYQILFDNTIIGNGGRFDNSDLPRVWKQHHYRGKHNELLQLMLNFKLCYEIADTQNYIIPELLPEKPSADKSFWSVENLREKGLLHFEYRYDFMPKGIISRLIVAMNKYIYNGQQWKNAVVLQHANSLAEIIENFDKHVLRIRIVGDDRLYALGIIRKEIKEIHDTFENLRPREMVPCNCTECQKADVPHFFDYEELKQYKNEKVVNIKCRVGKIKDVSVLSLISDVFIKEEKQKKDEREDKIYIRFMSNHGQPPIKSTPDFIKGKQTQDEGGGAITPKPPDILGKILWILRYWRKWWWLLLLALLLLILTLLPKFTCSVQEKNSNLQGEISSEKQAMDKKLRVTLMGICAEINSLPLAQQSESIKQYFGMMIKKELLRVKEIQINPGDENRYDLRLTIPDETSSTDSQWIILCNASKDQYPQLRIAREGMEFYVSGEIESAFWRFGERHITLSNVTLEFE